MKGLLSRIRISLVLTGVLLATLCGIYPLAVYWVGQFLFPFQATGSLVRSSDGTVLGSALLGQNFRGPQYFHPRPSAAGVAGYDAAASGGRNLGPTSKGLIDAVSRSVADYRKENLLSPDQRIPADAVTASASGLDPHISLANALLQLPRVARERKRSHEELLPILARYTSKPWLGLFGDPVVNVAMVNWALDGKLGGR
ncbi:K(+)-transporting ATPase subunit C [Methylacidimicrobium sp. B4]|uniref:K(+)-transporting ATPase subunit C n=1 Tax=Methylacidimicrobium sp. B4 TaxID=2796139 RepID=UPI001A908CB5|nr:K(+)-transporting ATPase subunit C [Methylacidimicrobium sp. B4]QSR84178.1 K(+)-transporting ATPase subunit C [Methylacidimicrobium sp. B4]